MGFEKRGLGRLTFSFRCRFNTVFLEDVANDLIGDLVPQVGQDALDLVVSPGRILIGKS